MDRYDAGDRVSVEELISSAESGVEVELTRDGKVMARVVRTVGTAPVQDSDRSRGDWRVALERLHASLPPEIYRLDWQAALRDARDDFSA